MIKSALLMLGSGIVLMASGGALAFDRVPALKVDSSCQTAAKQAMAASRDFNSCVADEHAARDKLAKDWSGFVAADRSQCVQLASISPSQSYIQLLTCLEFAKEARASRNSGETPDRPASR